MHTLLLLAALSNQITFTTTQQGDIYTVIPQVTLNEPCVCQVQILSVRDGVGGQSHTQQKQTLSLPANQPIELSRLSVIYLQRTRLKLLLLFRTDNHCIYHNNGRLLHSSF